MSFQSLEKMCFCTLALGRRYRKHAAILAEDLQKYAPTYKFVVLTDRPKDFNDLENTIALNYRQQTIGVYHDKKEVIRQALQRFDSCLFLDADVRILDNIPESLEWPPGITAYHRSSLEKRLKRHSEAQKHQDLIRAMIEKLGLEEEDPNLKIIIEYCFAVSKDSGKEVDFLDTWDKLAVFFEINNFTNQECFAIGLAARKAGLNTYYQGETMDKIKFFKDHIEKLKVKGGQPMSSQALECLEQHRKIEFEHRTFFHKVLRKAIPKIRKTYLQIHLRLITFQDPDFYKKAN
jgi:hypothetical protein